MSVCTTCKTPWDPGYFKNSFCPKCSRSVVKGFGRLLIYLVKVAGVLTVAYLFLFKLLGERYPFSERMVEQAYDIPAFFVHGPDHYASTPTKGQVIGRCFAFPRPVAIVEPAAEPAPDETAHPFEAAFESPAKGIVPDTPVYIRNYWRVKHSFLAQVTTVHPNNRETLYLLLDQGWWQPQNLCRQAPSSQANAQKGKGKTAHPGRF